MNAKLLLFTATVAAFCSCSTAHKTTQTPDDVYFSPARFYDEERKDDRKDNYTDTRRNYAEERQIRLGFNDPRWRYFDNDISYNPYLYGYNYGYYYNPYYYYLPVYSQVVITPANPKISTPRTTNLAAYSSGYNNTNNTSKTKMGYINYPVRTYNNSNNNSSRVGNTFNKLFNHSSSDNNSSQTNRSYTPTSSNNSSSSNSSSSSSGSTTRPVRNGKN